MIQKITSLQNPLVKKTAELKNKKARQKQHAFFLEGKRAIEEALTSGWCLEALFFTSEYKTDNLTGTEGQVPCYLVDEYIMEKMSATEHPQSIGAVVHQRQSSLTELLNKEGIILILDGVMDPGNLGTIIRTADAAGAMGVIVLDASVDLFNPKVIRSTMGSIFHLPVITDITNEALKTFCQREKIPLWATCLEGAEDYHAAQWPKKLALVMGNEARGVSEQVLSLSDKRLYIPMPGKAESLNVAIAAGILLFAYTGKSCQSK